MCLSLSLVSGVCSEKRSGPRKWYFSLTREPLFADVSSFNVVLQREAKSSGTTGYARSANGKATN